MWNFIFKQGLDSTLFTQFCEVKIHGCNSMNGFLTLLVWSGGDMKTSFCL